MKFIIGRKQQMTQKYREDGTIVPVTAVHVDRCVVTQVKTTEKDGYNSVQLGIGFRNKEGKAQAGHIAKFMADGQKAFSRHQEIRFENEATYQVGDVIDVNAFAAGDTVAVTGVSKGKGFQGVVKRHGFGGSPASHGHKDQLRMPGSIGAQDPQRVFKGTRMAGRMGNDQVTVKNLEIVEVDAENAILFVKGALPGARNGYITIKGEGEFEITGNVFAPAKAEQPVEEAPKEEPAKETEPTTNDSQEQPSQEEAVEDKK